MDNDKAADLQAWIWEVLPIARAMEIRVDALGEALACSVPLSATNTNHFGSVHAAVHFAVAEVLGGLVAFGNRERLGDPLPVVEGFTIKFIAPAFSRLSARAVFSEAELAAVEAALKAEGRARYTLQITLCDEAGTITGTATGQYYLRAEPQ